MPYLADVTMKTFCLSVLFFACCLSIAHADTIYKYVDKNGNITFTNVPIRGAQALKLAPISGYSAPRKNPANNSASSPDDPTVNSNVQKQRDAGRRKILEQELANEEKALADAKKALADGSATRNGDETHNYQKYLDRVQKLKDAVTEREKNIEALRRELGQG